MTPVEKPLTYNLKQRNFIRLRNPKTNTLMQIGHFLFCRFPEGNRKLTGRLPEGLLAIFCFTTVPEAPGRFPEG